MVAGRGHCGNPCQIAAGANAAVITRSAGTNKLRVIPSGANDAIPQLSIAVGAPTFDFIAHKSAAVCQSNIDLVDIGKFLAVLALFYFFIEVEILANSDRIRAAW
jgi:hypothetical protein